MENQNKRFDHLGGKTLLVFILKRCTILIIMIPILAGMFFAVPYIPPAYANYANLAISVFAAIIALAALIVFLIAWLEYIRYKIELDENSIKISRGILTEKITGVPFRHIKQAAIERSIFDQIIGVSKLSMNVLGQDEGQPLSDESKIILPALDKNIATQIQNIILHQSDVEKVDMETEEEEKFQ